jgi:hypothetical protein
MKSTPDVKLLNFAKYPKTTGQYFAQIFLSNSHRRQIHLGKFNYLI